MYRLTLSKDGIETAIEVELDDDCLSAANLILSVESLIISAGFTENDIEDHYRESRSKNIMQ